LGKQFEGTEDLWKLLTRKNIDYNSIDKNDLHKYKNFGDDKRPFGGLQSGL
jgi:hypothetical protein